MSKSKAADSKQRLNLIGVKTNAKEISNEVYFEANTYIRFKENLRS